MHNVIKGTKVHTYRNEVMRPMLKSYIFAQLSFDQQKEIWNTKSVNKIRLPKHRSPSLRKKVSRGGAKRGKIVDSQPEKVDFLIRENAVWVPIYTRPLHEFRLLEYLREHQIPAYLPVVPAIKVHNVIKGTKVHTYRNEVMRPMLKSYIFAQLSFDQQKEIWNTKSVNNIWKVSPEQQPGFIEELRGLQMMEVLARDAKLEYKKEIQVNDRFIIESPREFRGVHGYLVAKRKKFLWAIKLDFLGQFIDVEIDPCKFEMQKIE